MARQIDRNAALVAELAVADWRMGYVIACSVKLGTGGPRTASGDAVGKVSAREFADLVRKAAGGTVYGMGERGIRDSLAKWDEYAQVWDIPLSADLTPRDADSEIDYPDIPWKRDAGTAGANGKVKDILTNPKAVAEALQDPRFAEAVAAQATPTAKQNAARSLVDDQALDDPFVKSKVRGQVSLHDDASRQYNNAAGADDPNVQKGKATIDAVSNLGSPDLATARAALHRFRVKVEAGQAKVVKVDHFALRSIIDDIAYLSASVDLSEVSHVQS